MRYALALLSMISLLFLTACETPDECSWSAPIHFDPSTKEWLAGVEWPASAYADFDKIGDHNELRERYCN